MPLNVRVQLGNVRLRRSATPPPPGQSFETAVEPYLWAVFFKIDDAEGSGDPVATVFGPPGSHGSLGVGTVAAPTTVRVPRSIGRWDTGLNPLPARAGTINGVVGAIIGVVAILLEEDNVSDDGAEEGRRELVRQVRKAMDAIAANLVSALNLDLESFKGEVESEVIRAIRAEQNFLENLWSFVNKDDIIGTMVWYQLYSDLENASAPLVFSESWTKFFTDWSLEGRATTFTESRPRLSRTSLDFGPVGAGLIASRRFTISNFTARDVSLELIKTGSQLFLLSRSTVDVPRSRQASIEVKFIPAGPGVATASVVVKRAGSSGSFATLLLAGSTPGGPAL